MPESKTESKDTAAGMAPRPTTPTDVTPAEAQEYLRGHEAGQYSLIDVRQDWEYEEEHVPGARLLPLAELADRMSEVPRDRPAMVYCRSGKRSAAAAGLLAGQGYEVLNILGGMSAWQGAAAEGDTAQGLEYLPEDASAADVLALAYAMEANLGTFYAMCAESADAGAREAFERLARFEEGHKAMVLRLAREHDPVFDKDALLARAADTAAVEGGFAPQEASARLCAMPAPAADVLETAMAFEAQALDLYMRASARAEGEEAARLLRTLADEEKRHLQVLDRMLAGLGASGEDA
ncbi:Rhodanese-like protein [Desulfovibrio sp. X2]|uniref:rhodanese-like domain-containing protein n=1 Tax=Desulfovibrio sp. X2 TaxID=941449 RepID=UPI000358ADE1|nr:rhodanese-like domain-containing protein [Desulfovibrio sp. X2]EPR37432.1 Rhodanese-like protein [Desulfovibrio sp. X2]